MADTSGTTITAKTGTFADLVAHLAGAGTYPDKKACPLVNGSTFGTARTAHGSLRHSANVLSVSAVEIDYDMGQVSLAKGKAMLESAGIRAALHPSPSSTADKPRWRVIAPLASPTAPSARAGLVARLNGVLGGIAAPESFTLSQGYFYGGTKTNDYAVSVTFDDASRGQCVDLLPALDATAIGKAGRASKADPRATLDSQFDVRASPDTLADLASALQVLDSDDRGTWVEVGHALKTLGDEGLNLWLDWSETSPKFDPDEAQGRWDGFDPTGTGYKAVFAKAQAAGWLNPKRHAPSVAVDFSALTPEGEEAQTDEPRDVSLADLASFAPDAPAFWADEIVPADVVTLLGAHGGTGKTTLALYAAVCFAMGLPFLGKQTKAAKVLFYSAEDDAALLRWRLASVCTRLAVDPVALSHRLSVVDASEADSVLYVEASHGGVRAGEPTKAFSKLVGRMATQGTEVLILDNASDVYGADENSRTQVRAFIRLLAKLVRPRNGAVILLAHVDKLTARTGGTQGYSGSTAWHNSVRSRLFLSADEKTGDLLLEHQKSNRGKRAGSMRLVWRDGLPMLDYEAAGASGAVDLQAQRMETVLSVMSEFQARGEHCSTSPSAHTNAYRVLTGDPSFPRMTRNELFDLLRNAERQGRLSREDYRSASRHPCQRWAVSARSPTIALAYFEQLD